MEGHRKNTYLISTASMLDKATLPQALRWRIEDHARLARDTGFDGIELWPQKFHPLRQIKQDNISSDERASIHSLHQSVRQSAWRIRSLREAKREVQKAFFLPEINNSLQYMDKLFEVIGNVPAVFVKETPEKYFVNTLFTERLIQPGAEAAQLWTASKPGQFVTAARNRGFTHIALDTHHLRGRHSKTGEENPFQRWRDTVPAFLPDTKELHIGIGRSDDKTTDGLTAHMEAKEMLYGSFASRYQQTDLARMLQLIHTSGWRGRVVIEMRPAVYKKIIGQKGFMTLSDLHQVYEKIRGTLKDIFGD